MSHKPINSNSAPDFQPMKILIVDDFEPDIRFLTRMLNSTVCSSILASIEVQSVQSIAAALSFYKTYNPDCILLDYNLPDMSGFDFVDTVRTSEDELTSAIVMMTGAGDENIAVQAMKLGVHDYLVKGQVTEEQLGWTIHSALERLRLHNQLADKHEELELFANRASHDMVSPLTNLSLYVECLQEQFGDEIEDANDTFDSIISIVEHMTGLIDGLSTYSQVGRANAPFDLVDLQELHRYILLVSESDIQEAGANIHIEELPTVFGDRTGLSQLFQNLIANAIKYRGHVPPEITIRSLDEGSHFHITVSDNGIGIEPQFHHEIFAPFKRLHSRTVYQGCGLGLATCKKIVQQHSGRIWVESALAQGTTVHIELPKLPENRAHRWSVKAHPAADSMGQEHRTWTADTLIGELSDENWRELGRLVE